MSKAANQVEPAPNTVHSGEGVPPDSPRLSCLQPLLQSANTKLSEQQKAAISHIIQNYDEASKSKEDDTHLEISLQRSKYKSMEQSANSDYNVHNPNKVHINWCSLLFISIIISISSFMMGYITVEASLIIDPSTTINRGAFNFEFGNLSDFERSSLIPSGPLIGAALGSIVLSIFSPLSRKYPRKLILISTNIPIIIGCILCILSVANPLLLVAGLILKGFGLGISSIMAPIILAEIAPTSVRHFITMFHQLFVTIGILSAATVTLPLIKAHGGWRYITSIVILPSILQLMLYKYLPATPRCLIANDKSDEASKIMQRFYRSESSEEIKQECEYIQKHIMIDKLMKNEWVKPLIIGIIMNMFQQWTGINVVIYRSQQALKDQKIDENNIFVAVIILYLINFVSTLICIYCVKMKHFKKKTLYYMGTCLMLLMSLFLGLINTVYNGDESLTDQLSISQTPLYVFGFAISLGPFNWELITEAFAFRNRIRFASICVFIQWTCNAILSLNVDNLIDDALHGNVGKLYFIFCGMIILCIMFINKYIPETTGKSIEDAVRMYMN